MCGATSTAGSGVGCPSLSFPSFHRPSICPTAREAVTSRLIEALDFRSFVQTVFLVPAFELPVGTNLY